MTAIDPIVEQIGSTRWAPANLSESEIMNEALKVARLFVERSD